MRKQRTMNSVSRTTQKKQAPEGEVQVEQQSMLATENPVFKNTEGGKEAGAMAPVDPVVIDLIPVDDAGRLKPQNIEHIKRLCSIMAKSRLAPTALDTPEKLFIAFQYCASFGLDPFRDLGKVMVINNTPCFYGEMPLAIVRRGGKLRKIKEFIIDENYEVISFKNKNFNAKPYAAVCITWREGDDEEHETFFTMDDAIKAGLVSRNPNYTKFTRDMLKYRARCRNLLDQFPEEMHGMNVAEFHFNVTGDDGRSRQEETSDNNVPLLKGKEVDDDLDRALRERVMETDGELIEE